jgi:hypothetical protein
MPTGFRLLSGGDLERWYNSAERNKFEMSDIINPEIFSNVARAEEERRIAKRIALAEAARREEMIELGLGQTVVNNLGDWQKDAEADQGTAFQPTE